MADVLMSVEYDTSRVLSAFAKLGTVAKPLVESAAYQTALAVKAAAQARFPKRPSGISESNWQNVVIQRRQIGGYVVMTGDVVGEKTTAYRRAMGLKNTAKSKYHAVKHVGLWLEFGTRRAGRREWLFPSAAAQETAHLRRIADALDRAVQEAGT